MYMVPSQQSNVGVLDTTTESFSTLASTHLPAASRPQYNGGAAVGTTIYFAPQYSDHILVLDTVSNQILSLIHI